MATSCGVPLNMKAARAGVKPLGVLADDDEINVLRPLVLERAILRAVKLHGAEIDVLLQLEAQAQQDALFQDAGLDLADGRPRRGKSP